MEKTTFNPELESALKSLLIEVKYNEQVANVLIDMWHLTKYEKQEAEALSKLQEAVSSDNTFEMLDTQATLIVVRHKLLDLKQAMEEAQINDSRYSYSNAMDRVNNVLGPNYKDVILDIAPEFTRRDDGRRYA